MSEDTSIVKANSGADLAAPDSLSNRFEKYVKRDAQVASAVASTAWPFISLDKGVFRINGESVSEPLSVIVLASIRENAYYDKPYNPSEPASPACYALGVDESTLAPPADLATKESDSCNGCWADQWGSAERGRGKRCRNTIRIAILPADNLNPDELATVSGARVRIPTMSMSGFGEYTNKLVNGLHRPAFSVVSQMELVDDATAQFKLKFSLVNAINDERVLDVIEQRAGEALTYLERRPEIATEANAALPSKAGKRTTRKVTQRKKKSSRVKTTR